MSSTSRTQRSWSRFCVSFPFFFLFFFCVCVFPRPREIGPPLFVAVLRWSRFSVMLVLRRSRHGPKPTRKQTRYCVLRCSTGSIFHRSDLSNYETSIPVFIVNRWSQFRNQSKFEYHFLWCVNCGYIYIYILMMMLYAKKENNIFLFNFQVNQIKKKNIRV